LLEAGTDGDAERITVLRGPVSRVRSPQVRAQHGRWTASANVVVKSAQGQSSSFHLKRSGVMTAKPFSPQRPHETPTSHQSSGQSAPPSVLKSGSWLQRLFVPSLLSGCRLVGSGPPVFAPTRRSPGRV